MFTKEYHIHMRITNKKIVLTSKDTNTRQKHDTKLIFFRNKDSTQTKDFPLMLFKLRN